jgi:hydrogenase maturation protease
MRILVAGIGNIFFGDDAFGSEVARELMQREWPEGVRVDDFGIRSYDLAYAILDGYDAVVFLDATPRGEPPGTISLIELDTHALGNGAQGAVDAHSMNPVSVLQMVLALGGTASRLYLIGCEPAVLETEELGLSAPVRAAIPLAVDMTVDAIRSLLAGVPPASAASPTVR